MLWSRDIPISCGDLVELISTETQACGSVETKVQNRRYLLPKKCAKLNSAAGKETRLNDTARCAEMLLETITLTIAFSHGSDFKQREAPYRRSYPRGTDVPIRALTVSQDSYPSRPLLAGEATVVLSRTRYRQPPLTGSPRLRARTRSGSQSASRSDPAVCPWLGFVAPSH